MVLDQNFASVGSAGSSSHSNFIATFSTAIASVLSIETARVQVLSLTPGSIVVEFDIVITTNVSLYWVNTPAMLYSRLEAKAQAGWTLPLSIGGTDVTCIWQTAWAKAHGQDVTCLQFPCELPESGTLKLPPSQQDQLHVLSKATNP